jgi:hypothetical protein
MSVIKYLPSQVKLDVQQAFNLCEKRWGSRGLIALVAYGSAVCKPRYETVDLGPRRFLFWKWRASRKVRIFPNDIDVAAIYRGSEILQAISLRNQEEYTESRACRFREIRSDGYSEWWADIDRYANLHLMCIEYNTLLSHRDDPNLAKVLDEGLLIWGDLPRPMPRLK